MGNVHGASNVLELDLDHGRLLHVTLGLQFVLDSMRTTQKPTCSKGMTNLLEEHTQHVMVHAVRDKQASNPHEPSTRQLLSQNVYGQ